MTPSTLTYKLQLGNYIYMTLTSFVRSDYCIRLPWMLLYKLTCLSFVAYVSALRSAPNWTSTKLHPHDISQFCSNIDNQLVPEGMRISAIDDNKYVEHIFLRFLHTINVNFKYSIKFSSTNEILQFPCQLIISILEAVNQSEEFRMKMQSNKQHHIDTNPESKGILLANRTLIIPTADDEL